MLVNFHVKESIWGESLHGELFMLQNKHPKPKKKKLISTNQEIEKFQ